MVTKESGTSSAGRSVHVSSGAIVPLTRRDV